MLLEKTLTVEEFEALALLPENEERLLEFIRGEIVEGVASPESSKLGVRMSTRLGMYLEVNDIGHLTGADGGYQVADERYIPDVGFICYARQPQLLNVRGYNPEPPDLAVEVLSPSNRSDEMRIKITNYLLVGTIVWLVNPENQTVEVYQPGKSPRVLTLRDTLDGGDLLPGFNLPVKAIFGIKD